MLFRSALGRKAHQTQTGRACAAGEGVEGRAENRATRSAESETWCKDGFKNGFQNGFKGRRGHAQPIRCKAHRQSTGEGSRTRLHRQLGKTSDWTARRNEAAPAEEPAARPVKTTRAPAKKSAAGLAPKPPSKPTIKAVAKPAPRPTRKPVIEVPVAKKVAARKVAVKSAAKPAARKTAPKSR